MQSADLEQIFGDMDYLLLGKPRLMARLRLMTVTLTRKNWLAAYTGRPWSLFSRLIPEKEVTPKDIDMPLFRVSFL
jgi:hypothetical protein